MILLINFLIK